MEVFIVHWHWHNIRTSLNNKTHIQHLHGVCTGFKQHPLPFLLFCSMTNKCTIISQIISLLHVLTLSCHLQGACNQYLVKLHKYFKCSCWLYLCNLVRYWLQCPWGWHDSVQICRSAIICEIIAHFLVMVQNSQRCRVHGIKQMIQSLIYVLLTYN